MRTVTLMQILALASLAPSRGLGAPPPASAAQGAPAAAAGAPAAGAATTAPPAAKGPTAELRAPIFSELFASVPVAAVDGVPITVRDLGDALAGSHGQHTAGSSVQHDVGPLIERLVNIRLIAAEAREMGLQDLPEYKGALAKFRETVAREMLKDQATRAVTPDAEEVEALVRDAVREYKLDAVRFDSSADADAFRASIDKGGPFDDLARDAIASKKGSSWDLPDHVRIAKMLPVVRAAVEPLKPGGVTAPIGLPQGYVVVRVADVRYPEDPAARAQAERQSVLKRQREEIGRYYEGLKKKYAHVDDASLKRIDFDAKKPGIEALKKDRRVLARIDGAKPMLVGDVAAELAKTLFHGTEQRQRSRGLNLKKYDAADNVLFRRLLDREAEVRRVRSSEEFKRREADEVLGLLFSAFLQKVIMPDVKVTESDLRTYYDANSSQFTTPRFYKLEALGFASEKQARQALDKLQGGADFRWVKENMEGQVDPDSRAVVLEGETIQESELPDGLEEDLKGAKTGDHRLHDSGDQHYVVHVIQEFPPAVAPYPEAREAIAPKVLDEKVREAIRDWAAKLRAARRVEVFITAIKV